MLTGRTSLRGLQFLAPETSRPERRAGSLALAGAYEGAMAWWDGCDGWESMILQVLRMVEGWLMG